MQRIKENLLFSNNFAEIYNDDVVFSGGIQGTHFRVKTPNSSCVIPVTRQGKFLLISSFNYATSKYILAFPKGFSEENERSQDTASRELIEETGFFADSFSFFDEAPNNPSILDAKCTSYIGWNCLPLKENYRRDSTEEIEFIQQVSPSELLCMIMQNEIEDTETQRLALRFFVQLYPMLPSDFDNKTSAYIMGAYCVATGWDITSNPYRHKDEDESYTNWEKGWQEFQSKKDK